MNAIHKYKPTRSAKYKAFVKSLPCVCCGAPADDPHHPIQAGLGGTMGGKCSDLFCIPLCRGCHTNLHHDVEAWEIRHDAQAIHALRTIQKAEAAGIIKL